MPEISILILSAQHSCHCEPVSGVAISFFAVIKIAEFTPSQSNRDCFVTSFLAMTSEGHSPRND
jgi:hypothetical protein